MTKPPHDIRTLSGADQLREASALFRRTMHDAPADDEQWSHALGSYDASTALGAYDDTGMIGTLTAYDSVIALPGGKTVPMAAVSRVGVRPDRTRRGVLNAVMRTFLAGTSAPIATLRASEGTIYRRYGYGVATRFRTAVVDTATARLHDRAPVSGDVKVVFDQDEVRRRLPELLRRFGTVRPGGILLSDGFWNLVLRRDGNAILVEHEDGVACYKTKGMRGEHFGWSMEVVAMFAATPAATATLWRYLVGVDLIKQITASGRPVDEDLDLFFADPRTVKYTVVEDETWLRLVDVPAALAARTYGQAEPVVVEVVDDVLPANAGRYLIGPDGAERTDRDPQIRLGVADLGAVYLGDRSLTRHADAGLVEVFDPAALADADRLFRLDAAPWCGTYF
jgi:predicted acetyltransferase